ncbi:MAG TPA: hypothetical protein VHH34_06480 [Pseudonocardiaceae bacterium]|nr:hypothetical protein [Pseudonocardiaceae bacterium]
MSHDVSFADLVRQAVHDQTAEQTTQPTLAELLGQVAQTGEALSAEQLRGIRFRRGSQTERDTARRRLAHHSREVAALVRDGRADEARDLIEDTAAQYAHLTDREPPARPELPARPTGHTERTPAQRKDVTPLRELLEGASAGVLPRARDLARLPVRDGATEQEITDWHQAIQQRAQKIAQVFSTGAQQHARQLARTGAQELGELLAGPDEQEDDTDDLSPRELASRIARSA